MNNDIIIGQSVCLISIVVILLGSFYYCSKYNQNVRSKREKVEGLQKQLQKVFSEIETGQEFDYIEKKISALDIGAGPRVVSEERLRPDTIRKIYEWELPWEGYVGRTQGFCSYTEGKIRLVFENNKLIGKDQIGLYERLFYDRV